MSIFEYWNIKPIGCKWYKIETDNTGSHNLRLLTFNHHEGENKTFNLPFLPKTNNENQLQVCILSNDKYKIGGCYPMEAFVYIAGQNTVFIDALIEASKDIVP